VGAYLLLLLGGCGLAGWLLAAFQVHWLMVIISLGIIAHLIVVGADAIVLANVWVIAMIFIAAVAKAWPPIWDSQVPVGNARLWAVGLLLVWMGAIALVVLLAFARQVIQVKALSPSFLLRGTVLLSWLTTMLGYWIYHLTVTTYPLTHSG